jgi:hypothetical protein
VCADEAPQLAAIEALIRQTLLREEEPGFEAEHRVPQTGATGQILKKPKKAKKPSLPQAAPGAMQVLSGKPRPQIAEIKREPAGQRSVAAVRGTGLSSGNRFGVQQPRSKPASKAAAGSRKPAGKPVGGRGKRQP